jgi:hypothetical protein
MHGRSIAYGALAALTAVAIIAMVPAISRAQQDEPDRADLPPQPFAPQLSALMNLLIQPRHAKLGLAGKAENWVLAAYEFNELKNGFVVVGKEVPRYKGLPVADLIDAAMKQTLPVMDFAIKAGDARQFNDHNFIVIKVPEASNYPNQDFGPK